MTHYLDIRIRALPEIAAPHVMEAVFGRVHNALAALQRTDIGVSFPEVDEKRPSLGGRLRLHGPEESLRAVLETSGLSALRDYAACGEIAATPATGSFRRVSRVQSKSNPERLRRRLAARHNLSAEEALERIPDARAQMLTLPFVRVKSKSTGHGYQLFISHGPLQTNPCQGEFSAYGLSATATVPWF